MANQPISDSPFNLHLLRAMAHSESTLKRQPLLQDEPAGPMGPTNFDTTAKTNQIYKFIVGEDAGKPSAISKAEADQWLADPFAELLLKQGIFPLTLNALVDELEKTKGKPKGLKDLSVFHIAEGGQIPWDSTTSKVNRTFRLVVAIKTDKGISTDILISTATETDSKKKFLQLMSWDSLNGAFNFYQRLGPFWIWSGNSFHSLQDKTRNKGPFSGHINGGPVMKELKQPWPNWRSMNATISSTIFPPDHPFLKSRFFTDKNIIKGGEDLESLVRSGMDHLNTSRLEKVLKTGKISDPVHLFRQILVSTNLNLTSSATPSKSITDDTSLVLPFSFFANVEALSLAGINPDINPITVSGKSYLDNLKRFDFALQSDGLTFVGDTHFAFLVPEPSAEDVNLLEKMIEKEIIGKNLAACLLMVDFSNPIFSKVRASLMQYVPTEIVVGKHGKDAEDKFIANLLASKKEKTPNTPENEFINTWTLIQEKGLKELEKQIADYFVTLQKKASTQEGYDDIVRLAESRRFQFKKTPLFEFPLTFAMTNVPSNTFPLELSKDGAVRKEG